MICGIAETVVAPILTGVAVGLALRGAAIFGEVTAHSLRADEVRIDLIRWMRDREREFTADVRAVTNSVTASPGGSVEDALHALMMAVLHEFRDRASTAVREYTSLARSESALHRLLRRRSGRIPGGPLTLTERGHMILIGWRRSRPSNRLRRSRSNRTKTPPWKTKQRRSGRCSVKKASCGRRRDEQIRQYRFRALTVTAGRVEASNQREAPSE